MEMLSSFRGDKHEFCLVVIKTKHIHSCPFVKIGLRRNDALCRSKWNVGGKHIAAGLR